MMEPGTVEPHPQPCGCSITNSAYALREPHWEHWGQEEGGPLTLGRCGTMCGKSSG